MSQAKGFSLIELMGVMSIVVIMLSFAVPSYQFLIQRYQTITVMNQVIQAISFAKINALRLQKKIIICPTDSGKSCGNDFTQGMMIFIGEGDGLKPEAINVLRVFPKISAGHLQWNRSENYLIFAPAGFLQTQNGTFAYFTGDNKLKFKIKVSTTGRARVE